MIFTKDTGSMSGKTLLNIGLLFLIISVIYIIWAIQPLCFDDWLQYLHNPKTDALFIRPHFPETGQQIRYCFSSEYIFPTNPFSLYRPWTLLTAVLMVAIFWAALSHEKTVVRAGLTFLAVAGFPYIGHVGLWNGAANQYTLSFLWMTVWYISFRSIRYWDRKSPLKYFIFFAVTFITSSWHEVWLITFAAITAYFMVDTFFTLRKSGKSFKFDTLIILFIILTAYALAFIFYTRGGSAKFINERVQAPAASHLILLTPAYLIRSLLAGTKEVLVSIKDSLPILLLIAYIKLNKDFNTRLRQDYKLLFSVALGAILFMYVVTFIIGCPPWRTRWLCILALALALYSFPNYHIDFAKNRNVIKTIRFIFVSVSVIWLFKNIYFTYIYTNIDTVKWLKYRQMVLEHNPVAMGNLGGCTLPKNRPKGVANWDRVWGAQDDRYRIFMGPSEETIHNAVSVFWREQDKKNAMRRQD